MHKRILIIGLVILAVVIAGSWWLVHNHKNSPSPTMAEQKKNAPVQSKESAAASNQPAQNIPISNTTSLSGLTVHQTNGVVQASAAVKNSSDTSATCVFTYENPNDKPVVRQTTVSAQGTTCDSGAIPEQEFTYLGQWKLTLRYYSNNTQAVATTDITIQ